MTAERQYPHPAASASSADGMDSRLAAAYRAAHYRVFTDGSLVVLRIDQFSAALLDMQSRYQVDCSTYITACNPASRVVSATVNQAAVARLIGVVEGLGFSYLRGEATDPAGVWPPEASLLVPGMGTAMALQVAHDHGQLAVVVAAADAIPRLLWTR